MPSVRSRMNKTQSLKGRKLRSDHTDSSRDKLYSNCLRVGCIFEVSTMCGHDICIFIMALLIMSHPLFGKILVQTVRVRRTFIFYVTIS